MAHQGAMFKGNPNTNDAARYSAAVKRWEEGGCKGPKPEMPESMRPDPNAPDLTPKERADRIKRENERKQRKLL